MKIPCQYPENKDLFLESCPNCSSNDVEESGDDFDGQVTCECCGLSTYVCYGTKNAIRVWNKRINTNKWNFDSYNNTLLQYMKDDISDKEIDDLYDSIELLMVNNKWLLLNDLMLIWSQRAWRMNINILLSIATATLSCKSKLSSRKNFIETCKLHHPDDKLWKGLD